MQRLLILLLILLAGFCIPVSAHPITTVLEPVGGFGSTEFARAVAINNSGWIVGESFAADSLATLWILTGAPITPGIFIPDNFADSTLSTALDIHDNGDLLLRSDAGSDLNNRGTCADPPCVTGAIFGGSGGLQTLVVAHFGGGSILSNTDFVSPDLRSPGVEEEWLSSPSLWGPIQPRTSNQLGETIHNFGDFPNCGNFVGDCGVFVRTVPEPGSIWLLLGLLGVIGVLRVGKRRKLLRL